MTEIKCTNIVSEVLACKQEVIVVDIKEKVPILTGQIDKLKYEIKAYIEDDNIFPGPRNLNNKFLKQVTTLNNDMTLLMEKIEEVTKHETDKSLLDIRTLKDNLEETKFALKLTTELVNINEALRKHEQLRNDKKYLEAMQEITFARKICKAIPKEEQVNLISIISDNITIETELLRKKIISTWLEVVILEKNEEDNLTTITIKISNNNNDLQQVIEAMYYDKQFSYFNYLAQELLKDILVSIINNTVNIENIESEKDNYELLVVKIKKKSEKMNYKDVFNNILTVFDFLCCKINYSLTSNLYLLTYIGNQIREDFCNEFIKNCLADTVPSSPEGLEKYKEVAKEIESLQQMLVQWNFFDKDCISILEYAGNIDSLFANKISQNYTEKARGILKKDLHDMVEVGANLNQSTENQNINSFPRCCVSRSALEYLNLARVMLDQAVNSEGMCAGRLLYTVKQLFDMYCNVLPQYHKKLLETIPQQVALYHNNCMYIAHELITYEEFYICKISKEASNGENFNYPIVTLRTTGTETFMKFTKSQMKQMEDILNDSELALLGQIEKLNANCEKNIRQCLRQLEILKTVWQKVLNYEVYNKSIGDLLNHFVNQLIKHILKVEDISAETSTLLVDMFTTVKNRGPNLFTEPKEINLYTKSWCKFNELILILNASLTDIYDRWADGKGPLAVEYAPEDIRRLIRALFQNTDRRAAVLAKIV